MRAFIISKGMRIYLDVSKLIGGRFVRIDPNFLIDVEDRHRERCEICGEPVLSGSHVHARDLLKEQPARLQHECGRIFKIHYRSEGSK